MKVTKTEAVPPPKYSCPHVVLLGAGASLAAFPKGDKHGRTLPLMNNLVEEAGLTPILDRSGIDSCGKNFEELYSRLSTSDEHGECVSQLEKAIFTYFARLELPDSPTMYDHLLLSLRKKDLIVTFNWDPFLWQALTRIEPHAPVPYTLFLHGNVAIGYCDRHKPGVIRSRSGYCHECGEPTRESRLLYPVAVKNYQNDPFIASEWRDTQSYLKRALVFTVFGYSAPNTDVEAIALLKEAWGDPKDRKREQIEIVNVENEDLLSETWSPFICREHYQIHKTLYDSMLAVHPRRSCEAMWDALWFCEPHEERPLPRSADWPELLNWYRVLIEQEREAERPAGE